MNAGKTTQVRSTKYPSDIIHAVRVVPMFAPMMTVIAWASVSSPALTKETVITVVADDDCTAQVTNVPVSIPVNLFLVIRANMCLSWGPAIFCRASLIILIP